MRQHCIKKFFYAALFGVLVTSCATTTTELIETWVDEAYLGKSFSDILVISVTDQEELRLFVENRLVAELKARGIKAISSAESFSVPEDRKLEKEVVVNAANASQSDGVILLRLISVKQRWPEKIGRSQRGRNVTRALLRLRTDLYDVKAEKRIWSGQSETWKPDSNAQVINEVIKVVIDDLYKKGLLPNK